MAGPVADALETAAERAEGGVPRPRDADAARVVDAYVAACRSAGVVPFRQTKTRVGEQARELLADGCPVDWLADRAAEMPANRWTDLAKHAARSKVPMTKAAPRRKAALDCPSCHGSGRAEDPVTRLPTGPCPCVNGIPAAAGR